MTPGATAATPPEGEHHRVVIVGAGFGGLGLAARLTAAGFRDVVLLEKEDDLGGTWYVNTYPGCQCDVPSLLYSLSSAPQPGVEPHLRPPAGDRGLSGDGGRPGRAPAPHPLRHRGRRGVLGPGIGPVGDPDPASLGRQRRPAGPADAGTLTADVLVLASGFLSTPTVPALAGLDQFAGTVFHSARWDHHHDLGGERVAVIGTGASAIQLVPQIQPEVARLSVFQRTPPWVTPRPDRPFRPWERWLFRRSPLAMRLSRARIYWSRELLVIPFTKRPGLTRLAAKGALGHLAAQVEDEGLRAKLTPDYALGCKRVLLSNDYYPALGQANVDLVTEPIERVLPHGILTADGVEHPVDTIILATGFAATDPPMAAKVRAADGRTMRDHWGGSALAYLGTAVAGFPNLFWITGPNTGLGHSSMIYMIEVPVHLHRRRPPDHGPPRPGHGHRRPETVAAFNDEIQQKLAGTVWNSGCASWYLDAQGRNTSLWPDFTWRFRRRTRRFDAERYAVTRRRAQRAGADDPPVSLVSRD